MRPASWSAGPHGRVSATTRRSSRPGARFSKRTDIGAAIARSGSSNPIRMSGKGAVAARTQAAPREGLGMVAKVEIVERLGERAVLLPALIEEGLSANDRLKIRLTMLQEAAAQVSEPGRAAPSMERERRGVGLTEPMFNATISGARRIDAETFLAPGAEALAAGIASDLKAMMGPIEVAEPEIAASLRARLDVTLRALPDFKGDRIAHRQVAALASAQRGGDDSLHLLVMDLHKALNRVAAATAVEEIDGARVHSLDDAIRARV